MTTQSPSAREARAMTYDNILVDHAPPVTTITINRPRQLNALSTRTLQEIHDAVQAAGNDETVRAIIITGSGERAFSAGADIGELQALETAQDGTDHSRSSHEIIFQFERILKPIIMAVNGYALGGGCELVMGGDIILASDNARFGQPEV